MGNKVPERELKLTRHLVSPPVSHPSCHAPSLCELPDGGLLLAFYAGSREGAPDSVVLGTRFDPQTRVWSPPEIWVDVPGRAPANPRVFIGPDRAVWLIVGINYGPRWCSGGTYLFLKRSFDLGHTWSDLELFWEEKGVLGKNKPLHLRTLWLLPVEREHDWSAAFLRSEDNGKTWEIVGDLGKAAGAHLIQPAVVPLSDGTLMAYMRSQEGRIFVSYSQNWGKEWSTPKPTSLPNNNSGLDMVRLRSGLLVLAYNPTGLMTSPIPVEEGWPEQLSIGFKRWGPRTPLCLSFSPDEGRTWPCGLTLEKGEGEYSYPAVIQTADGTLHVAYTYRRQAIAHVAIEENLIARLLYPEGVSAAEERGPS